MKLITSLLLCLLSTSAYAGGFVGNVVSLTIECPKLGKIIYGPSEETVGDHIEFEPREYSGGYSVVPMLIDLTDSSILFDYSPSSDGHFAAGDFNGYVFTDKNRTINDIINVTIDTNETTFVLTNRINYTKDQIFINVESLIYHTPNEAIKINVEFGDANTTPWFPWSMFLPAITNNAQQ